MWPRQQILERGFCDDEADAILASDRSLAEYAKKIEWHLDRPGFRAFEARAVDGTLAAVAYGWPAAETLPDLPFYHWVADSLGPEGMDRLWATRPFEVAELMVDSETRGQGLARRLLDDLCPANGVSWLITYTEASAVGLYRRLGWRSIGSGRTGTGIPLDFFVLDSRNR